MVPLQAGSMLHLLSSQSGGRRVLSNLEEHRSGHVDGGENSGIIAKLANSLSNHNARACFCRITYFINTYNIGLCVWRSNEDLSCLKQNKPIPVHFLCLIQRQDCICRRKHSLTTLYSAAGSLRCSLFHNLITFTQLYIKTWKLPSTTTVWPVSDWAAPLEST